MGCQHLFQRIALVTRPLLLAWNEKTGVASGIAPQNIILDSDTTACNIFTSGEVQWGTVLLTTTNLRTKGSCCRFTLNDEEVCFGGIWYERVSMILKRKNIAEDAPPHINIMYGHITGFDWSMLMVIEWKIQWQLQYVALVSEWHKLYFHGIVLLYSSLQKENVVLFSACFYIKHEKLVLEFKYSVYLNNVNKAFKMYMHRSNQIKARLFSCFFIFQNILFIWWTKYCVSYHEPNVSSHLCFCGCGCILFKGGVLN